MSKRTGKAKKSAPNSGASLQREWIAKDFSGKDSTGSNLTTVQLWWKDFESGCKAGTVLSDKPSSSSTDPQISTEPDKPTTKIESNDPKEHWYGVSTHYWQNVEASDDGMLGGFASISSTDLVGSLQFILPLLQGKEPSVKFKLDTSKAIDIGAGIGRITKGFLSKVFLKTDVMEQNPGFIEKAKVELAELAEAGKIGEYYCSSLQDFEFPGAPYDVIWIQWVLLYLIDADLISFLKRAKKALSPKGVIIIKENHTRSGFFVDKDDNSITRSDSHFRNVFEAAGLKVLKDQTQTDFPRELFPVTMYALK